MQPLCQLNLVYMLKRNILPGSQSWENPDLFVTIYCCFFWYNLTLSQQNYLSILSSLK